MFAYWIMFAIWTTGAIQFSRRPDAYHAKNALFWLAAMLTTALIGLRYRVGGDWYNYLDMYGSISYQDLSGSLEITDPGYALLNWSSSHAGLNIWAVNLVCGAMFVTGLSRLALRQPNPWLAMLVAVPYFIIVVAMGYTRQAAAIGMICLAIADASETRLFRLILLVGLASLFHKTAVLILPMLLVPVFRRNLLFGLIGGLLFVVLFVLVLRSSSDAMIQNYAQSNYDSQGAAIRVSMNVLAAAALLIWRKRFTFPPFIRSYWMVNAVISLASLIALFLVSASSGVDRIALFLIPLQIVVFSRLPYVLSGTGRPLPSLLIGVIAYSFSVQFVWLDFAQNAKEWVPYRTVLFNESLTD